MIETKAPHSYTAYKEKFSIFLAGSIEMGVAVDWQRQIVSELATEDILILNPRRDAWDSSWEQSIDNPKFREQVEWELDALDAADLIAMYFDPNTKSPITLLELGFHAAKNPEKLRVCCPKTFWRKGNIDITCARYGVAQVETIDELVNAVRYQLRQKAA